MNLARAVDTIKTRDALTEHNIVPVLADWSQANDHIKAAVEKLESASIPLLAVFPAGKPHEPIILRDLISQKDVLDAIAKAGPSTAKGETPAPTASTTTSAANPATLPARN